MAPGVAPETGARKFDQASGGPAGRSGESANLQEERGERSGVAPGGDGECRDAARIRRRLGSDRSGLSGTAADGEETFVFKPDGVAAGHTGVELREIRRRDTQTECTTFRRVPG